MTAHITELEGIGPANAEKLQAIGIHNIADFLERGSAPRDRAYLAEATGINSQQLLQWLGMADLYRIPGVGAQFAELLKATGVDTVRELRQRNPSNLYEALNATNEEKNLTRAIPALVQVHFWIEKAKAMDISLTY